MEEEANYCLNCRTKPCSQKGCPLENDIPAFIKAVKEKKYEEAYNIVSETSVLPGVCGIICPHQKQCQGSCIRGIKGKPVSIGKIETFIFEKAIANDYKLHKEKKYNAKVAVIGAGPAGLTCSAFLAMKGIFVTIYEKYDELGGLLIHGVPEFRLSRETIKETINQILDLGIHVNYNQELGRNLSIKDLEEKYDYIFLSLGANVSTKMKIKGEKLNGVYGGNELLEYNQHPDYKGKIVSIIGGGNVAIDCARVIKKRGASKVNVIYRRSSKQMPAELAEVENAMNEGINFLFQNNIVGIIGNEKVEKIELVKTQLEKKEGHEREVPVNIENSNYQLETDFVVMAIGAKPAKEVESLGLELNQNGKIKVNENYQTSISKIYAGGDLTQTKGTVAWAARTGREVAKNIFIEVEKST